MIITLINKFLISLHNIPCSEVPIYFQCAVPINLVQSSVFYSPTFFIWTFKTLNTFKTVCAQQCQPSDGMGLSLPTPPKRHKVTKRVVYFFTFGDIAPPYHLHERTNTPPLLRPPCRLPFGLWTLTKLFKHVESVLNSRGTLCL